jgi:hypothetical protein
VEDTKNSFYAFAPYTPSQDQRMNSRETTSEITGGNKKSDGKGKDKVYKTKKSQEKTNVHNKSLKTRFEKP